MTTARIRGWYVCHPVPPGGLLFLIAATVVDGIGGQARWFDPRSPIGDAMRAYLVTTGTLFVLLTAAHIVRVFQETHLAREPWFWLVTVIPGLLAVWAWRLYRMRTAELR
jgi:hypothetical protein